jgi:cytochrome c peroxidase
VTPRFAIPAVLAASVLVAGTNAQPMPDPPFSEREVRLILAHGPWPPRWQNDPSNRVSGQPAAIAFGERLFGDPRLSRSGTIACATCHLPRRAFIDGLPRAQGLAPTDRNTPGLANVRLQRWFGWDGAGDSLWAQSLRPILDRREMGGDLAHLAGIVRSAADLRRRYRATFGEPPSSDDETVAVNVAKALAAYQETIVSGRTPFDDFRDRLARGEPAAAARYPAAAQRGLAIFVGKGRCNVCHLGPNFTNGEFHDIGIPFFTEPGRVDPGRHEGIRRVQASRYNLLGPFNDDPTAGTATATRYVAPDHRNFGEFRVPSLRNVARTAPYMHNGSLATLREVVRHYSEIDLDRLHADGERILRPLHLSEAEIDDVVAFLESLADRGGLAAPVERHLGRGRKGASRSIGSGNMMVVFLSAPITVSVSR